MLNDIKTHLTSLVVSQKKIYLVMGIIFVFGIYLGIILFGENSVVALYKIEKEKKELIKEIEQLKESNQKLQKEYFLLKQLEPKDSNH